MTGAAQFAVKDSPREEDLRLLLERIASGDESALERFYQGQAGQVYRFLQARLRDASAASELLNEVMMEVWRTANRFEGRSQVRTWLLSIAHHKMVDHLRRSCRHAGDELDESLADDETPGADRLVNALQEGFLLRRCLDRLSDVQRLVVHLAFFEDLSYPEIAEIVDCPVGTVKTRMFHAKRAIKHCLQLSGGAAGDGLA